MQILGTLKTLLNGFWQESMVIPIEKIISSYDSEGWFEITMCGSIYTWGYIFITLKGQIFSVREYYELIFADTQELAFLTFWKILEKIKMDCNYH